MAHDEPLYGLLELDASGRVLYYHPEARGLAQSSPNVVGQNFFEDVVPFADAPEFRERVKSFGRGHEPARSFNFTFHSDGSVFPVRVLLARTREQAGRDGVESIFVHIRKAS